MREDSSYSCLCEYKAETSWQVLSIVFVIPSGYIVRVVYLSLVPQCVCLALILWMLTIFPVLVCNYSSFNI
ncbi:hypothetical protein BDQ17DRAFT_1358929 [Cyathus striatus]|nr:hypothetical protein BDQ17DRAFT_1358929 [Cyathus striatus]